MHTIGVLALQGDYAKHAETLCRLGVRTLEIRTSKAFADIDALVIPGGESTTIGKLLARFDILTPLQMRIQGGMPVFGTCAGMILLAQNIEGSDQPRIGVMDISVERNAYGRQIESFEADIQTSIPGIPLVRGVFIRAPRITNMGKGVHVLAKFEGAPVLVQQNNLLAASFHPELTDDVRVHQYFLSIVAQQCMPAASTS